MRTIDDVVMMSPRKPSQPAGERVRRDRWGHESHAIDGRLRRVVEHERVQLNVGGQRGGRSGVTHA